METTWRGYSQAWFRRRGVTLGLPYLGFYADWEQAPLFDDVPDGDYYISPPDLWVPAQTISWRLSWEWALVEPMITTSWPSPPITMERGTGL